MVSTGTKFNDMTLSVNTIREGDNGTPIQITLFEADGKQSNQINGKFKVFLTSVKKAVTLEAMFTEGISNIYPPKDLVAGAYDVTVHWERTIAGYYHMTVYPRNYDAVLTVRPKNIPAETPEEKDIKAELKEIKDLLANLSENMVDNQKSIRENQIKLWMLLTPVYTLLTNHEGFKDELGGVNNPHVFMSYDGQTQLDMTEWYLDGFSGQGVPFEPLKDK